MTSSMGGSFRGNATLNAHFRLPFVYNDRDLDGEDDDGNYNDDDDDDDNDDNNVVLNAKWNHQIKIGGDKKQFEQKIEHFVFLEYATEKNSTSMEFAFGKTDLLR